MNNSIKKYQSYVIELVEQIEDITLLKWIAELLKAHIDAQRRKERGD